MITVAFCLDVGLGLALGLDLVSGCICTTFDCHFHTAISFTVYDKSLLCGSAVFSDVTL